MPDSQPIQKRLGVLSLGYTLDLWDDPKEAFGDPRQGIVGYEDCISYFALIAHSPRKRHLKPIQLAENSWAYPTDGYNSIDSWLRMFFMAMRLAKQHRIDLIQVRESMYSGTVGYLVGG